MKQCDIANTADALFGCFCLKLLVLRQPALVAIARDMAQS
jgi:hypothetical protein